jgi:hypothetical protein
MISSDQGDEGRGANGVVVETKARKAIEEVRVRVEGVFAVEDLLGFAVDLAADTENLWVQRGVTHERGGRERRNEEELVVDLVADFAWEGEEGEG